MLITQNQSFVPDENFSFLRRRFSIMTKNPRLIRHFLLNASILAVLLCLPARINAQSGSAAAFSRPVPIELRRVLWSVPITGSSVSVATCDELLILNDCDGIRALNLRTGRSAWPLPRADAGWLIKKSMPQVEANCSLNLSGAEISNRCERWIGLVPGPVFGTTLIPFQLVALDLKSQGRLEWVNSAETLMAESDWNFCSPPVSYQGGTVALLSHHKHGVVAVEVDERGKPGWNHRFVHLAADDFRRAGQHPLNDEGVQIHSSGDSLFVVTRTKVIELVTTKEGRTEKLFEVAKEDSAATDEVLDSLVTATHIHRLSGSHWTSWEKQTARLTVERKLSERVDHIPGAVSEMVILTGKDVVAINATTGEIAWRLTPVPPVMQGVGRSALDRNSLLWPTSQELWQVDTSTGELLHQTPLKAFSGIDGGNLSLRGSMLLIESSERLWAMELAK